MLRGYKKVLREISGNFEQAELPSRWLERRTERLYTQRFFNRLMFLAFWSARLMSFGGQRDYLRALFEDIITTIGEAHRGNFHRKRLNTLFFWG